MNRLYYILLLFISLTLFGIEESIDLINENNISFIKTDNIKETKGKYDSKKGWTIFEKEHKLKGDIDLIIHFDKNNEIPLGNYKITSGEVKSCYETFYIGKAAGDFKGDKNSIRLEPYTNAIFAPNREFEDFSIEFYINPTLIEGNEIIFSWNNALVSNKKIIYQILSCEIDNDILIWKLRNCFTNKNNTNEYILKGKTKLKEHEWSKHTLSYSRYNGALEYFKNGNLEDIKFATEDNTENTMPLIGITGANYKSGITIGKKIYAKIDEFAIFRTNKKEELDNSKFKNIKGTIITSTFDLGHSSSKLLKINPIYDHEGKSEINVYYRITEDRINKIYWNENDFYQNNIKWIPYNINKKIENTFGRYIQFKIDLMADNHNNIAPIFYGINIMYDKNLNPLPPINIMATPLNGQVKLDWIIATSSNISGVRIYYGTQSGHYTKFENVDINLRDGLKHSWTLTNLENDTLYYIAIKSFDNSNVEQFSEFSKEIAIRPAEKYGF